MHAFIREAQVYFKKYSSYCYPPTDILKHIKLNNDVPNRHFETYQT